MKKRQVFLAKLAMRHDISGTVGSAALRKRYQAVRGKGQLHIASLGGLTALRFLPGRAYVLHARRTERTRNRRDRPAEGELRILLWPLPCSSASRAGMATAA